MFEGEFEAGELESLKIEPGLPIVAIVIPNKSTMSNTQKKAFIKEMEAGLGPDLGVPRRGAAGRQRAVRRVGAENRSRGGDELQV